ncbi:MAG: hypothetical protein H8E15_06445 [Planctomycetes bacterium]|nr:hypothetical protein [Planctomycetota bacterium]
MHDLDLLWNEIAGTVRPVAYQLKWAMEDRFVRFHSLPEKKRYPDNAREMRFIIDRHNEVLSAVFSLGEKLASIEMTWSNKLSKRARSRGYLHWKDVQKDADDSDCMIHLYYKEKIWSPDCLNWAITAAANEDLFGFMVIGVESKAIYHPYDGGMDIIMPSVKERDNMSDRFERYLPSET